MQDTHSNFDGTNHNGTLSSATAWLGGAEQDIGNVGFVGNAASASGSGVVPPFGGAVFAGGERAPPGTWAAADQQLRAEATAYVPWSDMSYGVQVW